MLISNSHKFVFLHIKKTGGSSVRHTLKDICNRRCGPHTFLGDARDFLGPRFDKYFKFSFVRNPWDRVVSMYEYNRQRKPWVFKKGGELHGLSTFKEFVDRQAAHGKLTPQYPWIMEEGKMVVDFLGRFEHFQEDFDTACKTIGIKARKLKEIKRTVRGPYQEYYDDDLAEKVWSIFSNDIRFFGYEFERAA